MSTNPLHRIALSALRSEAIEACRRRDMEGAPPLPRELVEYLIALEPKDEVWREFA